MGDYGNSFTFVSSGTLGSDRSDLNRYRYWSGTGTALFSAEPYRMCICAPNRGKREVTVYDGTSVWGKKIFNRCYDASDYIIIAAKKEKNDTKNTFVGERLDWNSLGKETIYNYNAISDDWTDGDSSNHIGNNSWTFVKGNVE